METVVLKKFYNEKIIPELQKSQGYGNRHQVPSVVKVVLNSGFNATRDKNWISDLQKDLTNIAGQKALITKAKKSVSNFKLREGMPIGCCVTLRGAKMFEFLERLIAIALPTIRDFRGVSTKLDGSGNYTIGITDHTIFPEVPSDTGQRESVGMDITIVTSANSDDESRELIRLLGMPFRKTASQSTEQSAPENN